MRSLVSPTAVKARLGIRGSRSPHRQDHSPTITPPQIRAAVWHSLIAGARGIIYFNHSFGGHVPVATHSGSCYANARSTVTAPNGR